MSCIFRPTPARTTAQLRSRQPRSMLKGKTGRVVAGLRTLPPLADDSLMSYPDHTKQTGAIARCGSPSASCRGLICLTAARSHRAPNRRTSSAPSRHATWHAAQRSLSQALCSLDLVMVTPDHGRHQREADGDRGGQPVATVIERVCVVLIVCFGHLNR
jgi:hypothetical protein